jgi:hypothetical protein
MYPNTFRLELVSVFIGTLSHDSAAGTKTVRGNPDIGASDVRQRPALAIPGPYAARSTGA